MHERASYRWSAAENEQLLRLIRGGAPLGDVSKTLGRSQEAVRRQLQVLKGHKPQARKPAVRRRYATEYLS